MEEEEEIPVPEELEKLFEEEDGSALEELTR